MPKNNRKPSMASTLEKRRETKSIIRPMQITCCFISHYPKRAVAGSTIEITQKNSKAVQTPLFTCARRPQDPSPMWLFVIIGWFLDPSGVEVWFHPGMCERTKRMSHSWYLHDKTSSLENLKRVHDCEFPTPIIVSTRHFHQILSCSILKHHTCMEH
jgi:hypothetical protein